ncbi:MAG: alpha/beta hydrolase, partial [Planctomycetota bacterium]
SHLTTGNNATFILDDSRTLRARWSGRATRLWLAKNEEGVWKIVRQPPPTEKYPARGGLFKSAFAGDAVLVYGTQGSEEENRWAESKARFDAQAFWRRGNGSLEIVPDVDFDASTEPNRNVVLYGNAQSNAAWPALLSTSPVQVRDGRVDVSVQANVRPELGDDLAVLMIRPRPGSSTASVAVVGGTGAAGMRRTNRMRYFVPGVVYPDLMILGPQVLTRGADDARAAGYFGPDWSVGDGQIEWRDLAL